MSKKPTEKSPPNKDQNNPNAILKYSGMAFQLVAFIAIGVFAGQKLDEYMANETPYITAIFAILSLFMGLYYSLKDLL